MMWNYLVVGPARRRRIVLFDGDPAAPTLDTLWRLAAEERRHVFGRQRAVPDGVPQGGLTPGDRSRPVARCGRRLDRRAAARRGLPLGLRAASADVLLSTIRGGTDVCAAFVGGSPLLPVWAGEIPCRLLGRRGRGVRRGRATGRRRAGRARRHRSRCRRCRSASGATPTARATAPPTSRSTRACGATATGSRSPSAAAASSPAAPTPRSTAAASASAPASSTAWSRRRRGRRQPRRAPRGPERRTRASWCCSSCSPTARARRADDSVRIASATALRTGLSPRHVPDEIHQVAVDPHDAAPARSSSCR